MKTRLALLLLIATTASQQEAFGQPLGAPMLTNSHREFTLSVNGGYFQKEIYGVENRSKRFLVKGILGVANSLDLFVDIGASKLSLNMSGTTPIELDDKYRLAYGAGFALRLLQIQSAGFSLFTNAQVFRTTNQPATTMQSSLAGIPVTQSLTLKYDWREATFSGGFVEEIGFVNFVGGVRGSLIHRRETKITANSIEGEPGAETREKGEYRSGFRANPFFGLEFKLPARYLLSCEIAGRRSTDYGFYIGISQTGKP